MALLWAAGPPPPTLLQLPTLPQEADLLFPLRTYHSQWMTSNHVALVMTKVVLGQ